MKKDFIPHLYDEEELLAYAEFEKFAPHNKQIYFEYRQAKSGKHFDVHSINYTGGCEVVELKLRRAGVDNYGDCFLEPDKYNNLMRDWDKYDCMPIYINFIGNYKNVYVWYLPMLTGYTYHPKVKVNGKYVERYGLHWDDAVHYTWNEELGEYTYTKPINIKKLNKKAKQIGL